jgi:glyoxylase-like metal-dependent hydrolase (beta-lactamase superfamily II)
MRKKYNVNSFVAGNCYSYIISDNGQALIVDPHISLAKIYSKKLLSKGLSLVGIVDTHTHADHISSAALQAQRW